MEMFKKRNKETLDALDAHLAKVSYAAGTRIFSCGDMGTDLFFVRKGLVDMMRPADGNRVRRLYTCGRGSFFSEMAFIDGGAHTTHAIAVTDVDVFVLSRKNLDAFAEQHKNAALNLMEGLAGVLTNRMSSLAAELASLES